MREAALLLLLSLASPLGAGADPGETPGAIAPAPFPETGWGRRRLTATDVDSIGRSLSAANLRLWSGTDSLYRCGAFGPPATLRAREGARLHLQLRALTGMECVTGMARSITPAAAIDEAALDRPFGRLYANYGVYPATFLTGGAIGEGAFALDYRYPAAFEGVLALGGELYPASIEPVRSAGGRVVPGLAVTMATALHRTVTLVYEEKLRGRAREEIVVDRGDTLVIRCLDRLEGMHVRRAGLHAIGALVTWRNLPHGARLPSRPRAGACAWLPGLALRLPGPLPDVGLEDLRDFDFPMPVAPSAWYDTMARSSPDWITVDATGTLSPWKGTGPRPRVLEEWFPDR